MIKLLNTPIIGPSVAIVDSSWIDMLAGLVIAGIRRRASVREGLRRCPSMSLLQEIQTVSTNRRCTVDLPYFNRETTDDRGIQSQRSFTGDRRKSDPLLSVPRDGTKAESQPISGA